jgi:hypothetical protein
MERIHDDASLLRTSGIQLFLSGTKKDPFRTEKADVLRNPKIAEL